MFTPVLPDVSGIFDCVGVVESDTYPDLFGKFPSLSWGRPGDEHLSESHSKTTMAATSATQPRPSPEDLHAT